jgi:hypothetical protein
MKSGENAAPAAAIRAVRFEPSASSASAWMARTRPAADRAAAATFDPSTDSLTASTSGHPGSYWKKTRPSRSPVSHGRKNGSWVDAGSVASPERSISASEA